MAIKDKLKGLVIAKDQDDTGWFAKSLRDANRAVRPGETEDVEAKLAEQHAKDVGRAALTESGRHDALVGLDASNKKDNKSGYVHRADTMRVTQIGHTTGQQAEVGGKLAPDTVAEGSSVFEQAPTTTDSEKEYPSSVTVNPNPAPREPDVRVNPHPPAKPE